MPTSGHSTPEPIHESQMLIYLREAYRGDPESSLLWQLGRTLRDPASPPSDQGRRRLHPLFVVSLTIALIAVTTWVYFTYLAVPQP